MSIWTQLNGSGATTTPTNTLTDSHTVRHPVFWAPGLTHHMAEHSVFSATTLIPRSGLPGHYMSPAAGYGFIKEDRQKDDDNQEADGDEQKEEEKGANETGRRGAVGGGAVMK